MQAYLDRIGYQGDRSISLKNLTRLVRCHLETVPFENLDIYQNPHVLSVQPEDLYEKVVNRRRGGVCFELNGCFCWLLRQLEYPGYPVLVRTAGGQPPYRVSHEGNIVFIDGRKYYCDVGYGGPGPKAPLCIDDDTEQELFGDTFRAVWDGVMCMIQRKTDEGWANCLQVIDSPCTIGDFATVFYFFTTNPTSRFTTNRIANMCQPNGHFALSGSTLSVTLNGEKTQREVPEEEIPQVLKEYFGIVL